MVGVYGHPDALDSLAAELTERARQVRAAGEEHRREGDRARWMSDAASAFRQQLARDCAAVDVAAAQMEQAADALHRHADEVRSRLAAIARAEQAVRSWLADRSASGPGARADVREALGELPEAGADAWHEVSGRLSRLGLW